MECTSCRWEERDKLRAGLTFGHRKAVPQTDKHSNYAGTSHHNRKMQNGASEGMQADLPSKQKVNRETITVNGALRVFRSVRGAGFAAIAVMSAGNFSAS